MEDVSSYGIVPIDESADLGPRRAPHHGPRREAAREEAPSNLAIIGRYILTPDIFPALEATARDRTGEIQLTNGLRQLLRKRPMYACEIDGVRHDTGNKLGFLKALVYFALRRPELAGPFRHYLETLRPRNVRAASSLSTDGGGRRRRRRLSVDFECAVALGECRRFGRVGLFFSRTSLAFASSDESPPELPFLRVVGDVPAAALELNRRRRHQPLHRSLPALAAGSRSTSENFWITSKRWPQASHWYS